MKTNVVLANSFNDYADKVNFTSGEWVVMRKLDGIRTIAKKQGNNIAFETREGKDIATLGAIAEQLSGKGGSFVIDGELCSLDQNGNEDFKSILKVFRKKDYTIPNPTIKAFDYLTPEEFNSGTSKKKYTERLEELNQLIKACKIEGILPIEYERLTSKEVFDKWQAKARACGWEGLILRKDVPYKNGRISELLKVKEFASEDYIVEDIEIGKMDFIDEAKGIEEEKECVKSLKIRHKGNVVSVGVGFDKEQRLIWKNDPTLIIGKKIEVSYFQETSNYEGTISLRFPTFKCVRDYEEVENGK